MEEVEKYSDKITTLMKEYEELVLVSNLYDNNRIKWKQVCVEK